MGHMLTSLTLTNFRNHASQSLQFTKPVTVIVGPNAQGKTSIIEAINLLATGDSFRAERVEEMIRFDQELARVQGVVSEVSRGGETGTDPDPAHRDTTDSDSEPQTLEVMITRGEVQGRKTQYRLFSVNQVRKRRKDFVGQLTAVVFRPEDMRLIEGSPSRRRSFMDTPLSVVYATYAEALHTYEQALLRRNKLLQQVRDGMQPRTVLTYWNLALIKHGELVQKYRRDFLGVVNTTPFSLQFGVEYLPSLMSAERLDEHLDREIAAGHTLIGPHKDDFSVKLPETQLRAVELADGPHQVSDGSPQSDPSTPLLAVETYGSRGQQRLGVLWLKLGEYEFLKAHTEQPPMLLLDDILSELDVHSRARVTKLLGEGQSIITTTEPSLGQQLQYDVKAEVIDLTLPKSES